MKNTVSKGILFYLLIFVGVILGIGCILMCILMFSPGAKIFGISYFRNNDVLEITKFQVSQVAQEENLHNYIVDGRIQTIEIKTNYPTIDIANTTATKYSFKLESDVSGFSNAEKPKTENLMKYHTNYNEATKTFTIEVYGPQAVLFLSKTSAITFNIPFEQSFENRNLNVVTESGNVTIANHEENHIKFANLNANIGNGYLFVNNLADVSSNGTMYVEAKDGTIKTTGTINAKNFNIRSEGSKITLANVNSEMSIQTKDSTIQLNNLTKNLYYSADAGILQAKTISGDFECSELVNIANIFVDKVEGNTLIPKASASNIEIKHAVKDVKIVTTSGTVKVGETNADVEIQTESGQIVCLVNSTSTSVVKFTTVSGDIDARFKNIDGASFITTQKGDIYFQYENNEIFKLEYTCDKNKPTVSPGISTGTIDNAGSFAIGYDPSTTTANKITVINAEGRTEFENNLESDYSVFGW